MNIKGAIKNILQEESNLRDSLNKVLRRIDLEDSIKHHTKWALNHYKSRLKQMSSRDFVDIVVYNTYIDDISSIFEDWSEDPQGFDLPKMKISEKEADKIQGVLIKNYSKYISNSLEKEKERLEESFILENDNKRQIVFFQKIIDEILNELRVYCENEEIPDWVDDYTCEELRTLNKMRIVNIKKTDSVFRIFVVNEVSSILGYEELGNLYYTLKTKIKKMTGLIVYFREQEQMNSLKREW